MRAYMFPGQGSQLPGMGKVLYGNPAAKQLFEQANDVLGIDITRALLHGSAEELRQTSITQPAIFTHSIITIQTSSSFAPDMVAGHSLGEFSALTACRALTFEQGLKLVATRASAMQKACEATPSTMAAITGLANETVETICRSVSTANDIVVTANYNCPGQIIVSGSLKGVARACEQCKEAKAKRALPLSVGGAFHSPLMQLAADELNEAIDSTPFSPPICPIYQNVDAMPHTEIEAIKENLKRQLTSSVKWQRSIENMVRDGASHFVECGSGKVLQGLVKKIAPEVSTNSL